MFVEPDRGIYEIVLTDDNGTIQTIEATDDHPFRVEGSGWKTTIELKPGDRIETDGKEPMSVVSVTDENRTDVTYNFTVADFHTYYVTERRVLVHNCDKPPSHSPEGAGRSGAFREAKRDNDIPTSQQPSRVTQNTDRRGNPQEGRTYEYEVPAEGGGTRNVRIRDDAGGHSYPDNPSQNRGPHFNDEKGRHYDY